MSAENTPEKSQKPEACSHETEINTDGRQEGNWETRYKDPKAQNQIKKELIYVLVLIFISLLILLLNWLDFFANFLPQTRDKATLTKYVYYIASGLLGGTTYNAKYLYRAVGRGYWSQDRVVWRILSPYVSMVTAFIIGTMVECGIVDPKTASSGARCVVVGFLGGYFADKAVGFMCDIADLFFGKNK